MVTFVWQVLEPRVTIPLPEVASVRDNITSPETEQTLSAVLALEAGLWNRCRKQGSPVLRRPGAGNGVRLVDK